MLFGKKKKRREPDFYEVEKRRIQEEMARLATNTKEYKESMTQLKEMIKIQDESKEVKKRLTKESRGQIIGNIVKGGLLLGGIGAVTFFEMKGNTYTGEKRKWTDTLISGFGRWFGK